MAAPSACKAVPTPQPAGTVTVGCHLDVADGHVGGVEQKLLPLEHGHLLRDARGDDAVEVRVQRGDALRDGHVELVEVFVIAAPGECLAVRGEDDSGNVVDRAGGPMVAGDPLGRRERDGTRGDRNVDLGVVELARTFGEVGRDLDRGGLVRLGEG